MKTIFVLPVFFLSLYQYKLTAQSPVTYYDIQLNTNISQTQNTANGWNAAAPYASSITYQLYYGQTAGGGSGWEREIMGFNVGSRSFSRQAGNGGSPFDKVVINRHPQLAGDTINAFYEFTTGSGNNLYLAPSYVPNLEDLINSYVCNRGSDNLFSNAPTTRANIERVDLIQTAGIYVINATSQGFLINERGGNDNFKVAVITGLNGAGNVSALGNLLSITVAHWGKVGPSIQTRVMSRRMLSDAHLRPKEDIATQTISGVYISLADLGVSNGATVYGLAIFPNDVTATMDLIGLTNVPTNTNQSTDGGLDMIAGMGYFTENFVLSATHPLRFSATHKNGNVFLQWKPSPQQPYRMATIQRSTDGVNFENIRYFYPENEAAGLWKAIDHVSALHVPKVFYRLRLVDLQGNVMYSEIQALQLSQQPVFEWKQSLSSNEPIQFYWKHIPASVLEVALLTVNGSVLKTYRFAISTENGMLTFPLPNHLPAGVYLLRTVMNGRTETRRVYKF